MTKAQIFKRSAMDVGGYVAGPAIIVEDETSVIVMPSGHIINQQDGTLIMGISSSSVTDKKE